MKKEVYRRIFFFDRLQTDVILDKSKEILNSLSGINFKKSYLCTTFKLLIHH